MADLAYWEIYHMNQIEARKHSTCAKRSLSSGRGIKKAGKTQEGGASLMAELAYRGV